MSKKAILVAVVAALVAFAIVNRTAPGKKLLGTNTTVAGA